LDGIGVRLSVIFLGIFPTPRLCLPGRRRPRPTGPSGNPPGCPTVGVRTGAPFVQHGLTGYLAGRLPPGRQCVANENDEQALAAYLDVLSQAQSLGRRSVRAAAAAQFDSEGIVQAVLGAASEYRQNP